MPLDLSTLKDVPRLLIEAELKPLQGHTIYPTNFPNLGAATYADPAAGWDNLQVESQQSMANLMESACWSGDTWKAPLEDIPYVEVADKSGEVFTWSTLEAHRLNSVYIEKTEWFAEFKKEIGFRPDRPFDPVRQLAPILLKYDPNSLIHGVMLESVAGVVRLPRALGAFIEAEDVRVAAGGGVKFDRNQPTKTASQTAKENYGNVIYSRDRYSPRVTKAYFNLDLRQIQAYVIDDLARGFLIHFALYKIAAVLATGCARRRECEFEVVTIPLDEKDLTKGEQKKIIARGRGLSQVACQSVVTAISNPEQLAKDTVSAIDALGNQSPKTLAPKDSKHNSRRVTRVTYLG
jgi:CRISPR-associated protein Csb1